MTTEISAVSKTRKIIPFLSPFDSLNSDLSDPDRPRRIHTPKTPTTKTQAKIILVMAFSIFFSNGLAEQRRFLAAASVWLNLSFILLRCYHSSNLLQQQKMPLELRTAFNQLFISDAWKQTGKILMKCLWHPILVSG
jgi:hypothetical protein